MLGASLVLNFGGNEAKMPPTMQQSKVRSRIPKESGGKIPMMLPQREKTQRTPEAHSQGRNYDEER